MTRSPQLALGGSAVRVPTGQDAVPPRHIHPVTPHDKRLGGKTVGAVFKTPHVAVQALEDLSVYSPHF